MPCIFDRDGVQIYLNTPPEHPPPHVHVEARGQRAVVAIESGALLDGKLRSRDLRYVQRVIAANRATLLQGFRAPGPPPRPIVCRKGLIDACLFTTHDRVVSGSL